MNTATMCMRVYVNVRVCVCVYLVEQPMKQVTAMRALHSEWSSW